MAIETEPQKAREPGGREPGGPVRARPWWMRPAVHAGLIGAVLGYLIGHWLGNFLAGGYKHVLNSGQNDMAIVLGYLLGTVGWLAGLGVFNDLLRQMAGRPARTAEEERAASSGMARYFRYSLDHKVVGMQYLVGMIAYFLAGGLFAMAIRTELLSPTYHALNANAYLMVVGEHGTMMIMMMSSIILGPFGNYLVPLMIGSKRVAFPRIEALSFWLTPAAFIILLSGVLFGGFPTGWTGYAPLSIQATQGQDAYAVAFGLMGISLILQRIKAGHKAAWQGGAAIALVLGLAAAALQVWQLLNLPFYPGAAGFASVFTGFYPVFAVVVLGAMIWLEILIVRRRAIPAISFVEQPPTYVEAFAVQRFQGALSAFTTVWNYLAVITVLFWVLFYLTP